MLSLQVEETHTAPDGRVFFTQRPRVTEFHEDIIGDAFWQRYPVIPLPAPALQAAGPTEAAEASPPIKKTARGAGRAAAGGTAAGGIGGGTDGATAMSSAGMAFVCPRLASAPTPSPVAAVVVVSGTGSAAEVDSRVVRENGMVGDVEM